MWHWVRRWRDWAMNDLIPLYRIRSQSQALHVSYEKAGLTLHHEAVPWNAEAVVVEASLRLPALARRKADFALRLGTGEVLAPEGLRRAENDDRYRLFFRLATPPAPTTAELAWRGHPLGQVTLNVLRPEQYLRDLRLLLPTAFVRLGDRTVAAQTFVSNQCRGLFATAYLRHPHGLAPLADLGLHVQFRSERSGVIDDVPLSLSSSQLAGKEALVSAVPRGYPRRIGTWTVTWMLGEQVLASKQVRAISQRLFQQSLRMSDTRFVVSAGGEEVRLQRQVPSLAEVRRLGPCFLVCSREAGMAGLCKLQVRAQLPSGLQSPILLEQTLLITDGPTLFAPGTVDVAELEQMSGFELRLNGSVLGSLSLRPIPRASFTSEGGFKSAGDFPWSSLAEEELNERLGKLMGG